MGNQKSKPVAHVSGPKRIATGIEDVMQTQDEFEDKYVSPIAIQVAHYTPASFPLTPVVTKSSLKLCQDSWVKVMAPVEKNGVSVSGMTLFYTEFYDMLEVFDRMGKFESVLKQHSGGNDPIAAKGAILIRIVHYVLALDPESEKCQYMLFTLGKSHNHKRIRPWQYSVFIQTLLNTMSSRLGVHATHEVMTAWVHLFGFVLRSILPVAIKGLVNETECDINVTTDFVDSNMAMASQQILDVKEIAKTYTKVKKPSGGRAGDLLLTEAGLLTTAAPIRPF
jgi:hemoglobin-like flavoprotein